MFDQDLVKYIYWEYTVAVLFFTEVFKLLFKDTSNNFLKRIAVDNPKWLTLILAVVIGIGDWVFIDRGEPNYYQLLISFGLAVLGYDYGLKIFKDLIQKIKDAFTKTGP
jgi:hypothetical protein